MTEIKKKKKKKQKTNKQISNGRGVKERIF